MTYKEKLQSWKRIRNQYFSDWRILNFPQEAGFPLQECAKEESCSHCSKEWPILPQGEGKGKQSPTDPSPPILPYAGVRLVPKVWICMPSGNQMWGTQRHDRNDCRNLNAIYFYRVPPTGSSFDLFLYTESFCLYGFFLTPTTKSSTLQTPARCPTI